LRDFAVKRHILPSTYHRQGSGVQPLHRVYVPFYAGPRYRAAYRRARVTLTRFSHNDTHTLPFFVSFLPSSFLLSTQPTTFFHILHAFLPSLHTLHAHLTPSSSPWMPPCTAGARAILRAFGMHVASHLPLLVASCLMSTCLPSGMVCLLAVCTPTAACLAMCLCKYNTAPARQIVSSCTSHTTLAQHALVKRWRLSYTQRWHL